MLINPEQLEKILIQNWTRFIDARNLMKLSVEFAQQTYNIDPNNKVDSLTISRFQYENHCFLVWLEYKIGSEKFTSEIYLSHSSIKHQKTFKYSLD